MPSENFSVRQKRKPVSESNPFAAGEKAMAKAMSGSLTALGEARDAITEQLFYFTYGSPLLQALVGLDPEAAAAEREPEREAAREQAEARKRADLEAQFEKGGAIEAAVRAITYILKAEGDADERSFAVIKALHDAQPSGRPRSQPQLKKILRDQSLLLRLDEKRAVDAIPKLLPKDSEERARTLRAVLRVVAAQGEFTPEGKRRLARIEKLFGAKPAKPAKAVKKEGADAGH